MARKNVTSVRIPLSEVERARPHLVALGYSADRFGEEAWRILVDMMEDPEKRTVPTVVLMRDTIAQAPIPLSLPSKKNQYSATAQQGQPSLRAAEEPKSKAG